VPTDETTDELSRELATALDALEASMAAHRALESVLLAILDHAPVTLVVTDGHRVRAASKPAEQHWSAKTGTSLAALPEDVRRAVDAKLTGSGDAPAGLETALVEEPGTDQRYVLVVAPA
jgi:hypothetical protein